MFCSDSNLATEPLMKTFTQHDYVNRLERLLGLIRITICLCNYTLSTGNVGHNPTAPTLLDPHDHRKRKKSMKKQTQRISFVQMELKNIYKDAGTWNENCFTFRIFINPLLLTPLCKVQVVDQRTVRFSHSSLPLGFRPGSYVSVSCFSKGWIVCWV